MSNPFHDNELQELVDMEYVSQSDYVWKEAPLAAVLLALEVLNSVSLSAQGFPKMHQLAKDCIRVYGDWHRKEMPLPPSLRKELYYENYGDDWEEFYKEEGFQ